MADMVFVTYIVAIDDVIFWRFFQRQVVLLVSLFCSILGRLIYIIIII